MCNNTKPLVIKSRSGITNTEKAFIFANYKTMTMREMSRRLNRSTSFVMGFMRKYGLKSNGKAAKV